MFSGAGVYRDGVFFALATSDGGLYLKCDSEIEQRFRDAGSSPFVYGRDARKVTMSYWSLPEEALDDPDVLKEWADLSYRAALRKPEKPKRARKAKRVDAPESAPSPERLQGRSARAPRSGSRAASRR
jgi:DNA transformation protein and related proteins